MHVHRETQGSGQLFGLDTGKLSLPCHQLSTPVETAQPGGVLPCLSSQTLGLRAAPTTRPSSSGHRDPPCESPGSLVCLPPMESGDRHSPVGPLWYPGLPPTVRSQERQWLGGGTMKAGPGTLLPDPCTWHAHMHTAFMCVGCPQVRDPRAGGQGCLDTEVCGLRGGEFKPHHGFKGGRRAAPHCSMSRLPDGCGDSGGLKLRTSW